ncbi:hypothetical protein GTW51_21075 [Aurantimonas aggregata]|uniref:Uncharacterized protein n=1 Tax=Aurantimonas aggregata TaxID=2047720 RepID=A0A6L9MN65_9HYPH|nr:hypothetical protein [Aurantimonas aggregata]NDV89165.1 hypothetical protein [Aurantimonas aggregata]
MTPLLIVALPDDQAPNVWWASDHYVISATSRLHETLAFDEACRRYAELHGEAHFFETQAAALAWADGYLGPRFLEVRAEIARAPRTPPPDFVLSDGKPA